MRDSEFLEWLYDRLIYQYGEDPDVDFVLRLKDIITKMQEDKK
jgi:hypothetical protein